MPTNIKDFTPLADNILVTELEQGMQKSRGGIILTDDNFKDHGIRPRWAKVWKIGPDIDYIAPGEWVLLEHGRWTLRIPLEFEDGEKVDVWKIDPAAILLVSNSEEAPSEHQRYTLS